MRQWLEKLNWKMERFMRGRYGHDSLNAALCVLALLLIFIAAFVPVRWLSLSAFLPLGWAMFRMYSKNLSKRRAENAKWLKWTAPFRKAWQLHQDKWADRKTHRYFTCPKCHETMRVPKGIEYTERTPSHSLCGSEFFT